MDSPGFRQRLEQAQIRLLEAGARVSEKDGKVRGVMFVPRTSVPGTHRGKGFSRVIPAIRVLPGPGEGPYRPLVKGEELVVLIEHAESA